MKPILFAFSLPVIGEVTFPAYFTLLSLGFGMAMWITYRESKKIELDPDLILDTNLWMIIWGVIGARVLHLIADGHFHEYVDLCVNPKNVKAIDALVARCTTDAQCGYDYLCDTARHVCYPPQDCLAAVKLWRGGLAYYGGFLFATAFAVYFLRKHKMPFGRVADIASPGIALGLFFGRMGCYLNGCCYGKETTGGSSWAVTFPRGSSAWRAQLETGHIKAAQAAIPVYPTQLYEAVSCLAIFAFLYYVWRPRKRHDGDILAGFMLLYAIARSVIEVFRDDDRGVFWGFISTSQIVSIPLVLLAFGIFYWNRRGARLSMGTGTGTGTGTGAGTGTEAGAGSTG